MCEKSDMEIVNALKEGEGTWTRIEKGRSVTIIYSQVLNKGPPRLLMFSVFFQPPRTLLGPSVY